jgi:hypothetical protein
MIPSGRRRFCFILRLFRHDFVIGSAAFYVFFHHDFIANIIVFIPDYIVYFDNHELQRHLSLYAALRTAAVMEASSAGPSETGARFDGPYHWTPEIGNIRKYLHPCHVPESGKLGVAPRLHGHRLPL